ncbi:MAG: sensor histidine kinase, partial [Bosea sp. (in: a-proteobacteria)]
TQERHLMALSVTYLDGLASAIIPYVLRDDVWEVFDAIDRSATLGGGFGRARVVVVNTRGETVAAGNPSDATLGSNQQERDQRFGKDETLVVTEEQGRAYGRKLLVYQDRPIGCVYADFDITHLLQERQDVLRTLIVSNGLIALFLAAIAYLVIRAMLAPLARLSRHIDRSVEGTVEPIPLWQAGTQGGEFWRLFQRYNALTEALNERKALARQLAAEERMASLGRLASGMAHEINNPLGGLFNAIDTLKRHGDRPAVRTSSLDLIERGLRGIRDVVRSTLATYRADREQRNLTAADLNDMRLLIGPEASRKRVVLDWHNDMSGEVMLPASNMRQVLLNLVLNAIAASAPDSTVAVHIRHCADRLTLVVEDEGPGLSADAAAVLAGTSAKPLALGEGAGLGLWMTRRLVTELLGTIDIKPRPLGGVAIGVEFCLLADKELRHVA